MLSLQIISSAAVSYTHLDVYKRQILMGLCHHIAITMDAEKQCCRTNNSKAQESRNDLKKTEDRNVTTEENVVIYR